MDNSVARIYLLDAPYHIDKLYDYYIPEDLRGTLEPGGFAAVPFGGGNRKQLALVGELAPVSEYEKLKPVIAPVCGSIVLSNEMLGLCLFMKEHFFCTVGDAVKAIIPSAALTKLREYYKPSDGENLDTTKLTPRAAAVYNSVVLRGRVSGQIMIKEQGPGVQVILSRLAADGFLIRESEFIDTRGVVCETAELAVDSDEAEELISGKLRGLKQRAALRVLAEFGALGLAELKDRYQISRQAIMSLADKGYIKITEEAQYRDPYGGKTEENTEEFTLSPAQEEARQTISSLCGIGEARAALLYGITGSGKTNVIKGVMDDVISAGKSVILLVPEIALTPQMVGIFRGYYGSRIAVIHSGLSKGERYDAWRRISSGDVDVCIGTRSAVFAPFKNIGLIVLDEEQEHTYKSDMDPKYHARDIARYRCASHKATMLLASATPSVESYKKAVSGKYTLVTLKERYGNAVLPEAVITDMRQDSKKGLVSPIGTELRKRLGETLSKREQAVLFINQRGYNRFLSCPLCGKALTCPNCSVSYTYHILPGTAKGYLFCHYCGMREMVPSKCSDCGNESLRYIGYGTQMIEAELKKLFPDAKTMRMDADTTQAKFSCDELLGSFRNGEADILLGTQMVTKGHDFPNVTLVGVVNADSSLYLSDYRANERTFGLITQVIGRAGRFDKRGCALIQTYNPDHPVLRLSADQNFEKFYENEIALRQSLVFPPYCDIVLFTLSSEAENELMSAAVSFGRLFQKTNNEQYPGVTVVVFGPMEAPLYKINGIYRMRFVIKCKLSRETRRLIADVYSEFSRTLNKKIGITADVNPNSL